MTTEAFTTQAPEVPVEIPPLQNGDRLSRDEFERRYQSMPLLKKAELLEGGVYMPSPVIHTRHAMPHFNFVSWLGGYCAATPGVQGGDNGSLRLDLDNMPQPDAYLIIAPELGGQSRIDSDGYVAGGPELIVEVAASSASYDLHVKLRVYRRNGVREYVVLRTQDREVDWFVLRGGEYERLSLGPDGLYQSEVFPGLWLDPAALLAGELSRAMESLSQGLATAEHSAFQRALGRLPAKGE